jgi:putative membrane protein
MGLAVSTAGPALAQQTQPSPIQVTPQPTQGQLGAAAGGSSQGRQGGNAQLGQTETQHMQQTLAAGTVALQTSEIALQKAQNPKVKEFAGFERDEQTTIAEVLRSYQEPAATGSGGAAGAGAGTAPEIPADKAAMMQQLQQTNAGAEFDRMYILGQLQGHRDLQQVQERYLQANTGNREHINMAKLALGRIKEHLAILQDLQKEIRG